MTRLLPLIAALVTAGVTAGANLPSYRDGWGLFSRKGELSALSIPQMQVTRVVRAADCRPVVRKTATNLAGIA